MKITTAGELAEAVAVLPQMPIVFETSAGIRYTPDPEAQPYQYRGFLVVPIVEDKD